MLNKDTVFTIIISSFLFFAVMCGIFIYNEFIAEEKIIKEHQIRIKPNLPGQINNDFFYYASTIADDLDQKCRYFNQITFQNDLKNEDQYIESRDRDFLEMYYQIFQEIENNRVSQEDKNITDKKLGEIKKIKDKYFNLFISNDELNISESDISFLNEILELELNTKRNINVSNVNTTSDIENLFRQVATLQNILSLKKEVSQLGITLDPLDQKNNIFRDSIWKCNDFQTKYRNYFESLAKLVSPDFFFKNFSESLSLRISNSKTFDNLFFRYSVNSKTINLDYEHTRQKAIIDEITIVFNESLTNLFLQYEEAIKRISPLRINNETLDDSHTQIYLLIYQNLRKDLLDLKQKYFNNNHTPFNTNFVLTNIIKLREYKESYYENYLMGIIITTFLIVLIIAYRHRKIEKK